MMDGSQCGAKVAIKSDSWRAYGKAMRVVFVLSYM
jgi:hypothetical protein